jgi:hypothetical protein
MSYGMHAIRKMERVSADSHPLASFRLSMFRSERKGEATQIRKANG